FILRAALIALAAFAFSLHKSLDFGRSVYNHQPGVCKAVHGIVNGSEDIELIQSKGIAFISSGVVDRSIIEGKMFLYDFNQKVESGRLEATELPIIGDSFDKANFHPHGLSLWIVNGVIRLYVISHTKDFKHSIMVFDYDSSKKALIHKKTITDNLFIRPNGIVAVGPDQFMITNDGTAQSDLGSVLEAVVGYRGGSVVFWDGKESHKLITGMYGSNGIAFDIKTNTLFVTELHEKNVAAYQLSKDKKTASLISSVSLYSACDNLFLASDGSLYTGCHPLLHETAVALPDCLGKSTSASQILRIKYDDGYKTAAVTEPYSNDGKEASASSVAVVYNNQMLIGTVCRILLHCEIADPSIL
ncbi:hypothetical protein PMAYCL1PPCAC_11465, partial [Pristionchus mayeri]